MTASESKPPVDLEQLAAQLGAIGSKLDGISSRLLDGDRLFRTLEYDLTTCLRGVQVLLLEKATKLQVVQSLSDVTAALDRLEYEHNERATLLAPDDIDTNPDNRAPVRDTRPSPAPDSEGD